MNYFLRQKPPNGNVTVIKIPLEEDNVRVGRKTVSQLSQYPQISREHAEFHRTTSGTLFVRDLNSSNGLYVNGKKVGTSLYQLNIGDIIGFGVPFLDDDSGFICILCTECNPSIVKHEVIEISDEEEECNNSNRRSNPVTQILVNENQIPLPKCKIEQGAIQRTNSWVNDIQAPKVSDTSSSVKSCNSIFYTSSVSENDVSDQDLNIKDTVIQSTSSQINSSVTNYPSFDELPVKICHVHVVRCDSEDFNWPVDVRNPFKKQKLEDRSRYNSSFKHKRKRIKRLSSDSDSNEETTSELSVDKNKKTPIHNNASNILQSFKKEKIYKKSSSVSSEEQMKHDIGQGNFTYTSSESNLKSRIENPVTATVHQEDVYKPLKSIDNEISYSQVEEVIIISDDESYLDFSSSQNCVHIKEEPADINEDIENQEDLFREIFDYHSECVPSGSGVKTVDQDETHTESVESIRQYFEDTKQKNGNKSSEQKSGHEDLGQKSEKLNNEADCDLEMQCSEESVSDDNFEYAAKIPATIQNASKVWLTSEVKDKHNDSSLNSEANKGKAIKKSVGRTLLTEPKPMQQRSRKIRGREEGFREQNKYHEPVQPNLIKKSEISKKGKKSTSAKVQRKTSSTEREVIKIGDMSSNLKNFKIPRKSKVQNSKSHIAPETVTQCKNACDISQLNSSSTKRKAAPVKTRPEKFGSRMAFLTDDIEIKPRKSKKSPEKTNLPNQLRPNKDASSDEKQSNKSNFHPTSSDKRQSNKSSFHPSSSNENQSNKSTFHPTSSDEKQSNKSNFHPTSSDEKQSNKFNFHPTSSDKRQSNKSSFHPTSSDKRQSNKSSFHPTGSDEKQSNKSNLLPTSDLQYKLYHNMPNDKSPSVIQQASKSGTVTLSTRDPRINKLKSPLEQDACKLPQTPDNSAIAPPVKVIDVRRPSAEKAKPISSAVFASREKPQLTSNVIIRNLINLKCVWLQEQAAIKVPPKQISKDAADLPLYFKSYNDYVNLFTPMIMLELWDYMFTESKDVFKSKQVINKFYFSILSSTSRSDCIELKCESIIAEKMSYSPKEGSIVILMLKEDSKIKPVFGYIFRHRIDRLDAKFVQSSVWKKLPKEWLADAKHWTYYVYIKKKEMSFHLGSLMKANGICYIRSKLRLADALGNFKNSPLVHDIIEPREKTFFVNYTAASPTREYTSGQMKVINAIHAVIEKPNLEPKIILVQGPPGTGKTHTTIGLLERLIQNCKSTIKILMVAPSNAAIDEIGCRLIELNELVQVRGSKLKFVRVGMEKQVHEKMLPYFLEQRVKQAHKQTLSNDSSWKQKRLQDLRNIIAQFDESVPNHISKEKFKCLKEEYNALKEQEQLKKYDYQADFSIKEKILKESHIVLSTLNSCGLSILLRTFKLNSSMQFSCCIIDEATQCTELEVLQPLMFGINKLILVGDHMQLPATVTSKLAVDHGFERSMFERFHMFFEKYFHKSPVFTLTEQFRMHSKICAFPSKYFYHKKLVTEPITDIKYSSFPLNPYVILDVLNSQETSESSSKVNCTEASVIANICKCFRDVFDSAPSIGIITPYQGQRSLYQEALHQNPNYRDIEINTIDGFQGREKDVIIFSCVRANSQSGGIGFLVSRNRLNVAITRAKKCLIICCHAGSLCMYPDWRTLFEDAKERKCYVVVSSPNHIPDIFDRCIKKQIA